MCVERRKKKEKESLLTVQESAEKGVLERALSLACYTIFRHDLILLLVKVVSSLVEGGF